MSYTCLYDDHGAQTLRLPPLFRFDSSRVTLERMDDGILIKPVKEKLTLDRLFAMIDEARREEGDLDLDRSGKVPSQVAAGYMSADMDVKTSQRVPGLLKGQIQMSDDFDEWPDDIAQALGMR